VVIFHLHKYAIYRSVPLGCAGQMVVVYLHKQDAVIEPPCLHSELLLYKMESLKARHRLNATILSNMEYLRAGHGLTVPYIMKRNVFGYSSGGWEV
jgi:hypothetical protein